MDNILTLFSNILYLFLWALQLAILVRVIFSFFMLDEDNVFGNMLYMLTEPFVLPFRALLEKTSLGGGMFDFSFLAASLTITLILLILPNVTI